MHLMERLIDRLEEAKKSATMEHAGFGGIWPAEVTLKTSQEYTDFIVKETALYRETWIISPLKEALEVLRMHRELADSLSALQQMMLDHTPEGRKLNEALTRLLAATEANRKAEYAG